MIYRSVFLLTGLGLMAGCSKGMDSVSIKKRKYADINQKLLDFYQTTKHIEKIDHQINILIEDILQETTPLEGNPEIEDIKIENLQAESQELRLENDKLKKALADANHSQEQDYDAILLLSSENAELNQKIDAQKTLLSQNDIARCAFSFSFNKISDLIHMRIKEEQKGIQGAVYRFTLYDIAAAWIRQKNNSDLKQNMLCVDHGYKKDFCEALKELIANDIVVFCPQKRHRRENMHHKFIIFECNKDNRPLLITGSFNCTGQADKFNWENVCIIQDQETINQFRQEFGRLSEGRVPLTIDDCRCTNIEKTDAGRRLNNIPYEKRERDYPDRWA